jgi:hypothetical protein
VCEWILVEMSTSLVGLGEKEKVRKKEAMEALVDEISRLEDENLAPSLRSALEVSFYLFPTIALILS